MIANLVVAAAISMVIADLVNASYVIDENERY